MAVNEHIHTEMCVMLLFVCFSVFSAPAFCVCAKISVRPPV